jgi:hypothetical protein
MMGIPGRRQAAVTVEVNAWRELPAAPFGGQRPSLDGAAALAEA